MKKIMFYMNTIKFGGAERVIVNLANKFSEKDYKVTFITSFPTKNEYVLSDKIERISLEDVEIQQAFMKKNLTRVYKLRKICIEKKPDIIISFMAEPNFRSLIATLGLKTKALISIRNDPNREYPNKMFQIVAKVLYLFASGVVFQTQEAQNWFSKIIQNKSKIILNHVDEKFYKVNFNGQRKDVVAVGRLEKQKNHELLIKSFAKISKEFPKEKLIIYGEGTQKQNLEKLVESFNMKNKIIFKGTSKEIEEQIKNAKLFILSSDYEGLPNVVMEAMTLGLATISTDCPCGGPNMLIKNYENGILVKVGEEYELATAMKKVLNNPELIKYLGDNAKKTAESFESNIIFKQWETYIAELCDQLK